MDAVNHIELCLFQVVLLWAVLYVSADPAVVGKEDKHDQEQHDALDSAQGRSRTTTARKGTHYEPEKEEDFNLSLEEGRETVDDVASDAATSYSSMVLAPGEERPVRYKTVRVRPSKAYTNVYRHRGESDYKSHKNSKQVDNQESPSAESTIHGIHPSLMRSLLKKEPQTFTDTQQSQSDESNKKSSSWQVTTNSGRGSGYRDSNDQQVAFDITKRPIYVPNRVRVHAPSSDSSFNVGYSIGFGNGQAQPLPGDVKIPTTSNNPRGKTLSVPISYQNTPVNIHFDNKHTFWKNMGSGVEMSQSVDLDPRPFQSFSSESSNDNGLSQSPVAQQPSVYTDDTPSDDPTTGGGARFSFDHEHAMRQSNAFDFSNAIGPNTNSPYSEDRPSQISTQEETISDEPYSTPEFPTFPDVVSPQFYESTPRQSRPSHVELSKGFSHSSRLVHNTDRPAKPKGYKPEVPSYERPSFPDIQSPVNHHPTPKALDFRKSLPTPHPAAQAYPSKATSSSSTHQIIATNHNSDAGYSGDSRAAAKLPPTGMIQAILVPVAPQNPHPFPYPVGMPIVGGGYVPFLGQPLGMVRIPEPVRVAPQFHPVGNEHYLEHQVEFPEMESPPVQKVHSHYTLVKHTQEQMAQPSQYSFPNAAYPPKAEKGHKIVKLTRVLSTEAPSYLAGVTSFPALYSPHSHYPSPHHQHPRMHGQPMIIVKRS